MESSVISIAQENLDSKTKSLEDELNSLKVELENLCKDREIKRVSLLELSCRLSE